MKRIILKTGKRKTTFPRAKVKKIMTEVFAQAGLLSARQLAKLSSPVKNTPRKASTKKAA